MLSLYKVVTNCTNVISVSVTANHGSSTAQANIECESTTLDIGNAVTIDIGYTGNHNGVLTGYVKGINKNITSGTYAIVVADVMTRATDYFIVPSSPTGVFTRSNITAEDLVRDLLALANLTSYDPQSTSFTFATNNPLEIKLVSVYDFCKTICDLIAWSMWATADGTIHFRNRKPYVMTGSSGQPGDVADSVVGTTITDADIISGTYGRDNNDLRNRVIVQGAGDIYATASASSSYLPNLGGNTFYKSIFFSDYQLITTQTDAQNAANYNLSLLNRLTYRLSLAILGDSTRTCRSVVHVTSAKLGVDSDWYVYGISHSLGSSGFTTALELRQ